MSGLCSVTKGVSLWVFECYIRDQESMLELLNILKRQGGSTWWGGGGGGTQMTQIYCVSLFGDLANLPCKK